jgi:hypothetical protein
MGFLTLAATPLTTAVSLAPSLTALISPVGFAPALPANSLPAAGAAVPLPTVATNLTFAVGGHFRHLSIEFFLLSTAALQKHAR